MGAFLNWRWVMVDEKSEMINLDKGLVDTILHATTIDGLKVREFNWRRNSIAKILLNDRNELHVTHDNLVFYISLYADGKSTYISEDYLYKLRHAAIYRAPIIEEEPIIVKEQIAKKSCCIIC